MSNHKIDCTQNSKVELNKMNERNLITALQKGDQIAFKTLVDKHKQNVFGTCMGFLHNEANADDITQEVFIEAFRSIYKFDGKSKISTWLYRIAVNKSLNYIRDNKKHKILRSIESFFINSNTELPIESDENYEAGFDIEHNENRKIIKKAINSLPKNQRIAFVLNKYQDLSYKEVAGVMDVSLSSVESLIHRAKLNLQKKLVNFYKK